MTERLESCQTQLTSQCSVLFGFIPNACDANSYRMERIMPEAHIRVAVIVGSLRKESYSRKIAKALIECAPASLVCSIVEISDLPMYNEDLDEMPPEAWTRFRNEVAACQAVLFVTPEYNRSIPSCLKNATDVGSRPDGKNVFDGMPAAVASVSPYSLGGVAANHALRQNFVYLNLRVMQQPEAYIGNAAELLGDGSTIVSSETKEFFRSFMQAFAGWAFLAAPTGPESFENFLVTREAVSAEYINGNAEPLIELAVRNDPATFFPPNGDVVKGAPGVSSAHSAGAKAFGTGSTGRFEVLQSGSSGRIAFWTGLQHAEAVLKGKDEPVAMTLRTTEVFRLENNEWKLCHRHADMLDAKAEKGA